MKLNKISSTLRKQGKSALYASAMLTALAAPSYALAADEAVAAAEDVEVIEVRGMRGTMTRSLNEKKNTSAIVDAIAAADFGDLPGLSLSDVIENVSGASGHRLKGSQNEISIRGLGSYWGYSTFNGRTITNAGPGRAVNFKKFPSDLVDKVVIYKSQQADLVEGGTSGTIEVGSLRAVDYGKSKTSVEYQAAFNEYYTEADNQSPWGGKLTFSTVQNWETDSLGAMGFSLGLMKSKSANPEENYGTSSTLASCSFWAADGSRLYTLDNRSASDYAEGYDVSERCGDRDNSSAQYDSDGNLTRATDYHNDTMVSPGRSADLVTLGANAPIDTGINGADHLAKFDQDEIFFIPDDSFWRTGSDEDERSGVVATFQWVPNDQWDINLDLAISNLEYTEERMELAQERAKNLNVDSLIFNDDGVLLYEEGEGRTTLQGENRNQVDDYEGYGIAIDYSPTDNLVLSLDASYSESYRYRLRQRTKFRHEDQIAYSLDSRGTVPVLHLGDSEQIENADFYYKNEGGQLVVNDNYMTEDGDSKFDVTKFESFIRSDGGAYLEFARENDERNDDVWALKFDAEYTFEDSDIFTSIKAGARYSREHLYDYSEIQTGLHLDTGTYRPLDTNWNSDDHVDRTEYESDGITVVSLHDGSDSEGQDFDDNYPLVHAAQTASVAACGDNGHSQEGFMSSAGGVGDANEFLTFDSQCLIGRIIGYVGFKDEGFEPTTDFYDIGENPDKREGQQMDVYEDIAALYVMANVDTEVGGFPVTGNIGLRYVTTETESKSWGDQAILTQSFVPVVEDLVETGDFNEVWSGGASDSPERKTLNDEYSEFLPSLNLTLHLSDEWLLRTAVYRAMSRFAMNAMSSGEVINFGCDADSAEDGEGVDCGEYGQQIAKSVGEGNMMRPYTSNNYDLSLEWYPSEDMAITLAGYYKSFTGGTKVVDENRTLEVTRVFADDTISIEDYPSTVPFTVQQVTEDESVIKGFELTFQKHFAELPGVLSGLGIKGAWNHAWSDFNTIEPANYGISPDANLFGFSKDVASGSIYWEGDALSMRLMYKYRSRYFQPNNLPFPHKTHRWVEDSDYLDAAIKYKVSKKLSVSLKALNLLEEAQIMTRGAGTVSDYSFSGRKFFLSAKYKF